MRGISCEIQGVKGLTDRSSFTFLPIEQKIVYGGMGTTLVRLRKCSCGPSKPEIRSTVWCGSLVLWRKNPSSILFWSLLSGNTKFSSDHLKNTAQSLRWCFPSVCDTCLLFGQKNMLSVYPSYGESTFKNLPPFDHSLFSPILNLDLHSRCTFPPKIM